MVADDDSEEAALARAWEERARSPMQRFFVASHPGWSDEAAWERCAWRDAAALMFGFGADRLARARVLEMGCGVGRLARLVAPRAAKYDGFDIAPSMVADAVRTVAPVAPTAEILVGDGSGPPPPFDERSYDLIYAWAVFIHVSRDIAMRNLAALVKVLAPDGQLRAQFFADLTDPTVTRAYFDMDQGPPAFESLPDDVSVGADAEEPGEDAPEVVALTASSEGRPDYIGHNWRIDELREALEGLGAPGELDVRIERLEPRNVYALVRRVPSRDR
jgi:SAM-dependent methyltransferase